MKFYILLSIQSNMLRLSTSIKERKYQVRSYNFHPKFVVKVPCVEVFGSFFSLLRLHHEMAPRRPSKKPTKSVKTVQKNTETRRHGLIKFPPPANALGSSREETSQEKATPLHSSRSFTHCHTAPTVIHINKIFYPYIRLTDIHETQSHL